MVPLSLYEILSIGMGPFKVPMILISVIVILLIAYAVFLRFRKSESDTSNYRKNLNAFLVVGSFSLALGMIGQITGIWGAINAIKQAGDVNPDIVITGIMFTFGSVIYGLITFIVAVLAWLLLTYLPVRK